MTGAYRAARSSAAAVAALSGGERRLAPGAIGLGWRREVAASVLSCDELGFVEVVAESLSGRHRVPVALDAARRGGLHIVPHGVGLSLGGAERPDRRRLAHLAGLAERLDAPLVSEHVAFVRAGGLEAGHLLPLPRTRDALDVLVANVKIAQESLPVPLALENVAGLFDWPDAEYDEADFLTELVERTGVLLLLDLANLYANGCNFGFDPEATLDRLPLEQVAYVHVAGGVEHGGFYRDTHAHPVPEPVLRLVQQLAARSPVPPPVMIERDRDFPDAGELTTELTSVAAALRPVSPAHDR